MTRLASFVETSADTELAIARIVSQARASISPSALFVYFGKSHAEQVILDQLRAAFPRAPIIGATSSGGVLAPSHVPHPADIGVLAISDPLADIGVGARQIGLNATAAARGALEDAMKSCGCQGELPSAVIVHQPPGAEESIIDGLRSVLGDRCPIIGGSAADDAVTGDWRVVSSAGFGPDFVAVMTVFTRASVSTAFQSGYAPTGKSGIVTSGEGRRLRSIDGRPAAEVYDEWTGGGIREAALNGGSVLAASALSPIGLPVRQVGSVVQHKLLHPAFVQADGSMEIFANIAEGQMIELMEGSPESLARRAGRVLSDARAALIEPSSFCGGLLFYCGGCSMSLGDKMQMLVDELDPAAMGEPFLGALTFGEQGMISDVCTHGNLMVSALAFSR
jgi:hypothetical protein